MRATQIVVEDQKHLYHLGVCRNAGSQAPRLPDLLNQNVHLN